MVPETAVPEDREGAAVGPDLHRLRAAALVGGRDSTVPHRGCLRILARSLATVGGLWTGASCQSPGLPAYYQHGAMGVPDYRVGDATHKSPPHPT